MRGGLGEVFVAHDGQLDRSVALKRMRPELATDERSRDRFIREAEITGRLEHPNIAPVYSLGLDGDKLPFSPCASSTGNRLRKRLRGIASHTADGEPGRAAARARGLLTKFNEVCDAVAFAHSKGIVHRDIKPANIILGRFGETILADWGLAKRMDVPETDSRGEPQSPEVPGVGPMTEHGSVLGTLVYMSPEQARSASGPLGAASDIYSLGATLLSPAHRPRRTLAMTPRSCAGSNQRRFSPASRGRVDHPRALEAIVLKAMAASPPNDMPRRRRLAMTSSTGWPTKQSRRRPSQSLRVSGDGCGRIERWSLESRPRSLSPPSVWPAFRSRLKRQQRQTAEERNSRAGSRCCLYTPCRRSS